MRKKNWIGLCIFNKKALKSSDRCVCYYCLKEFDEKEIKTADLEELICPFCNEASVIPVKNSLQISYWVKDLSYIVHGKT